MKFSTKTAALFLACSPLLSAADESIAEKQARHQEGSALIADKQDELSADVQQLTIEQTVPQVIELLNDVEKIMDEATDRLATHDTGGDTLAAQTEVIEKIHAAAKEKEKQKGSGQADGAMMDMMERMMGQKPEDGKKGNGKGNQPGDQGGQGQTGDSNTANEAVDGETGGKSEARRVPKAAGSAGHALPDEFRKALDAYNRGAEQKAK